MRKIVSGILAMLMLVTFASCAGEKAAESSRISDTESTVSVESEKTESKKSESTVSTVSKISSKASKDNEQTASKTKSKQVCMAIKKSTNLGLGIFHFNTIFATHYGESKESRLAEFEDVLRQGYVNTVFLADKEFGYIEESIKLCKKYNCSFWFSPQRFFSKNGDDLDIYMANAEKSVNVVLKLDAWDLFEGFYWDEPFLNFMTNDDFLLITKSLYEKWGKRNFPVFSQTQFIEKIPSRTKDGQTAEKIKTYALKYITDVAWDNYSYDLGKTNKAQDDHVKENAAQWGASFTTAADMYKYVNEYLLGLFDHKVNVWFYPGAYSTSLWTGGRIDEDVASNLLDWFNSYLNQQKYRGGLMLYTYLTSNSSSSEKGLAYWLDVPSKATGKQVMFPDAAKWSSYSSKLKQLKNKFDTTTVFPAVDVPFGSFLVLNDEEGTIEYMPLDGCKYSIDGGKTWSNTGYFENLELDTEYTVKVKNSKGQTKDFKVTTDYR